jgi:hypothetical protein
MRKANTLLVTMVFLGPLRVWAVGEPCSKVADLQTGDGVLIQKTEGATLIGTVVSVEPSGLTLDMNGHAVKLECDAIEKVSTFKRSQASEPTGAVPVTSSLESGSFAEGLLAGESAAEKVSVGGWGAGGFVGGTLCGPLGCLAVTNLGMVTEPTLSDRIVGRTPDYAAGYVHGYENELRRRRAKTAFGGGAVGAAILTGLYFYVMSNDGI